MIDKLVIDCSAGKTTEVTFTPEEIAQRQLEQQQAEEQAQLESLKPSAEEIERAEFELETINLLTEIGVI